MILGFILTFVRRQIVSRYIIPTPGGYASDYILLSIGSAERLECMQDQEHTLSSIGVWTQPAMP